MSAVIGIKLEIIVPSTNFLLDQVEIVSATNGSVEAHLRVLPVHLNSKGTLHGTVSACVIDWAGGLAIASTGRDTTGVSTDLHTTYIATAQNDDLLVVSSTATKVGRTLAFTTVSIIKLNDDCSKSPVANGTHTKYVAIRKPQS